MAQPPVAPLPNSLGRGQGLFVGSAPTEYLTVGTASPAMMMP